MAVASDSTNLMAELYEGLTDADTPATIKARAGAIADSDAWADRPVAGFTKAAVDALVSDLKARGFTVPQRNSTRDAKGLLDPKAPDAGLHIRKNYVQFVLKNMSLAGGATPGGPSGNTRAAKAARQEEEGTGGSATTPLKGSAAKSKGKGKAPAGAADQFFSMLDGSSDSEYERSRGSDGAGSDSDSGSSSDSDTPRFSARYARFRGKELMGHRMLDSILRDYGSMVAYVEAQEWTSNTRKREALTWARAIDVNIAQFGLAHHRGSYFNEVAQRRIAALLQAEADGNWVVARHYEEFARGCAYIPAREQARALRLAGHRNKAKSLSDRSRGDRDE